MSEEREFDEDFGPTKYSGRRVQKGGQRDNGKTRRQGVDPGQAAKAKQSLRDDVTNSASSSSSHSTTGSTNNTASALQEGKKSGKTGKSKNGSEEEKEEADVGIGQSVRVTRVVNSFSLLSSLDSD